MSIMDFPLVNEIISNLWLFQTESVVPLFGELSLMILILFVIAKISGIFLDLILNKTPNRSIAAGYLVKTREELAGSCLDLG